MSSHIEQEFLDAAARKSQLQILPDPDGKFIRENMRRIEAWAKARVASEASLEAEALRIRFLLMGS